MNGAAACDGVGWLGSRASRAGSKGFTLVEVMVALAILSLVMLTTIAALRTLGNTQVALDRMTDRVDQLRSVSSFLRDAMESAVGGEAASGGLQLGGSARDAAYIALTRDSLAWKSTMLFGEGFGGSYLLRVAAEDDLLVLRWQLPDNNGQPGDWASAPERTLAANLEEFTVSWRKAFQDEWRQGWEKGDVAGWVRLQIKTAGRYWPELILQVPR